MLNEVFRVSFSLTYFYLMFGFFLVLTLEHGAYLRATRRSQGRPKGEGEMIAELCREVEELASKGKKVTDKIYRLQADLDHEAEA